MITRLVMDILDQRIHPFVTYSPWMYGLRVIYPSVYAIVRFSPCSGLRQKPQAGAD